MFWSRVTEESPFFQREYSHPVKDILGAIRLKMWDSLEGQDAKRFKQNRITIEQCPEGFFTAFVDFLDGMAKREGELGTLLWRKNHVTKIKDGEKLRSSFTINTITAAKFIAGFHQLQFSLDSAIGSFGHGILRISDIRKGNLPLLVVARR